MYVDVVSTQEEHDTLLLSVAQNTAKLHSFSCHLFTCTTLDHTQFKLMSTLISNGYSRATDTEKHSISTDTDSNTCIGGTLVILSKTYIYM